MFLFIYSALLTSAIFGARTFVASAHYLSEVSLLQTQLQLEPDKTSKLESVAETTKDEDLAAMYSDWSTYIRHPEGQKSYRKWLSMYRRPGNMSDSEKAAIHQDLAEGFRKSREFLRTPATASFLATNMYTVHRSAVGVGDRNAVGVVDGGAQPTVNLESTPCPADTYTSPDSEGCLKRARCDTFMGCNALLETPYNVGRMFFCREGEATCDSETCCAVVQQDESCDTCTAEIVSFNIATSSALFVRLCGIVLDEGALRAVFPFCGDCHTHMSAVCRGETAEHSIFGR